MAVYGSFSNEIQFTWKKSSFAPSNCMSSQAFASIAVLVRSNTLCWHKPLTVNPSYLPVILILPL